MWQGSGAATNHKIGGGWWAIEVSSVVTRRDEWLGCGTERQEAIDRVASVMAVPTMAMQEAEAQLRTRAEPLLGLVGALARAPVAIARVLLLAPAYVFRHGGGAA